MVKDVGYIIPSLFDRLEKGINFFKKISHNQKKSFEDAFQWIDERKNNIKMVQGD